MARDRNARVVKVIEPLIIVTFEFATLHKRCKAILEIVATTTCLARVFELYFQAWLRIYGCTRPVHSEMQESYKALRALGAPVPLSSSDLNLLLATDAVDTSCPARLGDSLMAALSAAEPGKLEPILQDRCAEIIAFIRTQSSHGRVLFGTLAVARAAFLEEQPMDAARLDDYVSVCSFGIMWLMSTCHDVKMPRPDVIDIVYRIALQHAGPVLSAPLVRLLARTGCRPTDARMVAAVRLALATDRKCILCGDPSSACRGCRDARYCSLAHQQLDWPTHAANCRAGRTLAAIFAGSPPLSHTVTSKDLEQCLHEDEL